MDNHFTVPENYFEQLNRDIQTRIAEERLKALTDGRGFIVPDLYFEQLSSRIEARLIPEEDKKAAKVVRLWNNDLLKYATAACFILITAFGLYLNNRPAETPVMSAEMASEQFLLDIDEQLILDEVGDQQLRQTNTSASEQELETYILSNYSSNEIAANF
ncbi:hypothetical protein [Pedobacter immunditicola]|uniref:hypothetical protein n=1 Tax=Pedobacter immunditicola TaxID=3133440 RepID=UPI0030A806E6